MNFREFDALTYIEAIVSNSRTAADNGFKFVRISGLAGAEELVSNMRRETSFIAIDETSESTIDLKVNGPFERKMYTIFILRRYKRNDESDRAAQLRICRYMMLKMLSWFLHDSEKLKDALIYLDNDIQARDLGEAILNGVTGVYFTFSFARPTDIIFEDDEWEDPDLDITNTIGS